MDRNRSRSEGNVGEEIKDVRPILSSVTNVWNGRSKAVTEDQCGLSELGRRKTTPTPKKKKKKRKKRKKNKNGLHISCMN